MKEEEILAAVEKLMVMMQKYGCTELSLQGLQMHITLHLSPQLAQTTVLQTPKKQLDDATKTGGAPPLSQALKNDPAFLAWEGGLGARTL